MKINPIAVLSHAHFLEPGVWEEVMWGKPQEDRLGVLSKSIEIALRMNTWIYLCCGIPKVGGRKYSPNSRDFILKHYMELPWFLGDNTLEDLNRRVIFFDEGAQTTKEEVANAEPFLLRQGVTRVISVTAPKHAMRALQDLSVAKLNGQYHGIEISATPSDVDFPCATAANVSILERAHRHDTPPAAAKLDLVGSAVVSLMRKGDKEEFAKFMGELATLAEKYGTEAPWK